MVDDRRKGFSNTFPRSTPGGLSNRKAPMYGQDPSNGYTSQNPDPLFLAQNNLISQDQHGDPLAEAFGRMNIQNSYGCDKLGRPMSNQSYDGGIPLNGTVQQAIMYNGQLMFTGNQLHPGMTQNGNTMTHVPGMFPTAVNQPGFQYNTWLGQHSPLSSWPNSRVPSGETPSLITPRRDSSSSRENDVPGTPFNGYYGYRDYSGGVAVVERSPHSLCTPWSTPSPVQSSYKAQQSASISPRLQLLVQQEPAIPRAVPAPYSPVKPLDRALENANGSTNVYLRGLQPDTTDEMLYKLGARFGDITSSKSIIDHSTGKCKGFGFVKYHSFRDAEDCIRGFHYMGYETSFARVRGLPLMNTFAEASTDSKKESFYAQLKKLSDEQNTNLYVSNLPKNWNESELGSVFSKYKVCSSRILRDGAGNGRGVGFARFDSREVCEDVIKIYDKYPVDAGDGTTQNIQIRFADTQDQKALKQQTTAARQYRTAEYESQTACRPSWTPNMTRFSNSSGGVTVSDNDFETYMVTTAGNSSAGPSLGSVRDRMNNVSSQLASNGSAAVNGHAVSALGTVPEPRVATVNGNTKSERTSEVSSCANQTDYLSEGVSIDSGVRA